MSRHDDPPHRSDAELLAAHVAGEADAFGELVARHRDRLWAVALRTTGNPEDAADGLQEGLVAAFRRAGGFRGEAAVTTWLHRVVVNACLDRLRAARVRHAEPLPEDLDSTTRPGDPREALDPADAVVAVQDRERVLAALATLPAEQRAALVLVDMEGYPVAQAAEILDCPVGTVKSRCARGRARLAVLLGVREETDPVSRPERPAGPGNRFASGDVEPPQASRAPPAPR